MSNGSWSELCVGTPQISLPKASLYGSTHASSAPAKRATARKAARKAQSHSIKAVVRAPAKWVLLIPVTFDQNLVSCDTADRAPLLAEDDNIARELWSSTNMEAGCIKWNVSIHKAGEQFKEGGAENIHTAVGISSGYSSYRVCHMTPQRH